MKKKYIKIIGLLMAVVMCVVMVACSGSTNTEATYDFEKNFRELSLNGDEYANMGELVDSFEGLSDDNNTCIVIYGTSDEMEVKECGILYDINKKYYLVQFSYITDYTAVIDKYNIIVSMDSNGNVVPEAIEFATDVSEYENDPNFIINNLEMYVMSVKIKVGMYNEYNK